MSTDVEISNLEWRVVEAAVAFREAESQAWIQREVGTEDQVKAAKQAQRAAYIKLAFATEDLVFARKAIEQRKPQPIGSPS